MLAEELAREVGRDIEALFGRQAAEDLDLEALETAVRQQVLALAGRFLQRRLNDDTSDYTGARLQCRCGGEARYAGRRQKSFHSVFGRLQLERAYYHCDACGHGWFPRDRAWGIEEGCCSPAVMRMIATVGAMVSFQEGGQLLEELAAVRVSTKQVERIAEALGEEIAADEKRDQEAVGSAPPPPTLYLGIDGTGVPMRPAELSRRRGKQPDGSAKTREVKLCTAWSAEGRDTQDRPVRDPGSISYTAAIESAATLDTDKEPAQFTQRVLREADRRRFTEARRQVVIGDGALWIWKIAQELFPRAIQIVDKFHAKQHLSELAGSLYGSQSEKAHTWAERRHAELDAGRFDELLKALRRHAGHCEEARKCFQYFHRNRERMRYPKFEAEGLCTGSGVVEAGCKVVVGTRLKRAGMRWTLYGANSIIALRCSKLSGRFQDFWARRSDRLKAA